jgi:hypothetical protein
MNNKKPSELILEIYNDSPFSKAYDFTPLTEKLLSVIDHLSARIDKLEVYHQIQQGIDECDLKEMDKNLDESLNKETSQSLKEFLDNLNEQQNIQTPFPFVTEQDKEMVKNHYKDEHINSNELFEYVLNTTKPDSALRELAKRAKDNNVQTCTLNERRFLDYIKCRIRITSYTDEYEVAEIGDNPIHNCFKFTQKDVSKVLNIKDDSFNFGDFNRRRR